MGDFLRKAYDEQYYKELFEMQLEVNKRLVNTINSLVDYLGG